MWENQNPIYYLKNQFQLPKNGCKGMKLVSKMARRKLEHKFPFETFRLEKQDLPSQML